MQEIEIIIKEIEAIELELSAIKKRRSYLVAKHKQLDELLQKRIEDSHMNGIKYKNKTYILREKKIRKRKKKKEVLQNLKDTMQKFNLPVSDSLLQSIIESTKGNLVVNTQVVKK